jgi:SRSO17 transposase
MPVVPSSLDALLFLFVGAFSAPTFETFRMLVVGFVCRTGEHTVCGMLQAARLERVWHHSRAYAFFSARQWCPDKLGLLLLDFLVATFVAAGEPIRVAVDDSLFKRAGKQVYGAAWQYDGSVPKGAGRQSGYGNNWVSLCLVVRLPFMRRAVGLSVLFRLWRPDPKAKQAKAAGRQRQPNPDYPSKPELARKLLELLIARYPERKLELVGDSAYATKAFAGLPERVSVTSRLKSNAQLYAPKPPRTGKRGQPAKKGRRLPKLKAIADDPATVWEPTEVVRGGKRQSVLCHTFQALWYDVWGQRPVRVVLIRGKKRTEGYDLALISMDMHASPAQIIERYDERWAIEVSYEDAKQITGVGEARNRTRKAVERTVPFGFLCQTLTIAWYALYGHAEQDVEHRRRHSPWYWQKRFPSYQDMLSSLRRAVIAAQYLPVTPRRPTQQQIPGPAPALKALAG